MDNREQSALTQYCRPVRRSRWLAMGAAVVTLFGCWAVFVYLVSLAASMLALAGVLEHSWFNPLDVPGSSPWYVIQAGLCLSAAMAGVVCAALAPERSKSVPVILIGMIELHYFQAEFPRPFDWAILFAWSLAVPIGFVSGFFGRRAMERRSQAGTIDA